MRDVRACSFAKVAVAHGKLFVSLVCPVVISTADARSAGEALMDFFERLFGISPDAGNGSLEMLYLLAAALVLVAFARWHAHRAANRETRQ